MNPAVTLTFRYLPGEYGRAVRAHQLLGIRLVPDLLVSLMVLAVSAWTVHFGVDRYFWLGVVFCGIGLVFPTMIAVALFVLPRTMLARNPRLHDTYQLTFSDNGIRFQITSVDSSIEWSLYTGVTEVREFYLLYLTRRQFTAIPKRAFETAAEIQAFEALLVEHISQIARRV